MSNLTTAWLKTDYQFEQTHSVHHNRSDNFIRYFIDEVAEMIPEEFFSELLVYKPETELQAKEFLQNQYRDYVGFHGLQDTREKNSGNFFLDLKQNRYDVILLDNYMDVASKIMRHRTISEFSNSPLFINPGFYQNEAEVSSVFDWFGDFLTPKESALNWMRIYKWLRQLQPHAKIFFLTYHSCSSTSSPDRYWRAFNFYLELRRIAREEDLHIVPPLSVPEELTEGQINWPHFKMPVYKALAGYVFLNTVGGWPKPDFLHDVRPMLELPPSRAA
jgi:hypothetical protein